MINIRQNGEVYEVSFPYDTGIIYHVKNVPGRRWIASAKMWTIPRDKLGFLINEFKGTQYEPIMNIISNEQLNVNSQIDTTKKIPDIDISDVPFYVKDGAKPFSHQLDFMKWAINRENNGNMSGFILADEMGIGKSVEASNLAIYNKNKYGFKHCLIICCINSSKYNWKNDIYDHTRGVEQPYILGTRRRKNGSEKYDTGGADKLEDLITDHMYGDPTAPVLPYFLIMNIEAIRYKAGRKFMIADEIISWINDGRISMVIIDEIHKNASPSSQQGKQLIRIKKYTESRAMWVSLTGTPITKQPIDVYTPLKLCDGHNYNSFYIWCKEFCVYGGFGGYEILGYKNIPKLKYMLEDNMIRRLKSDVLELPPKIKYTEYVENTPYQRKLYTKILADINSERDEIISALNPLAKLLRLRQVNGSPELVDPTISPDDPDYLKKNAKLVRLLELLDDAVSRDEKTVIFSNWVEPLRTLYKFISKKYKTCAFTGTMSTEDREKHKKVFMENPEYKVLLGTIGAAGTAHTFTSARNVIFFDDPWNPSDKEQAEDRLHRIGTTESINVFTLVSKDTIDEKVEQILYTKDGIAKYIVDGKLDLRRNPDLFDLLIGGN
jgi:SNF2 family DNA or RNA helicase